MYQRDHPLIKDPIAIPIKSNMISRSITTYILRGLVGCQYFHSKSIYIFEEIYKSIIAFFTRNLNKG